MGSKKKTYSSENYKMGQIIDSIQGYFLFIPSVAHVQSTTTLAYKPSAICKVIRIDAQLHQQARIKIEQVTFYDRIGSQ